MTAPTTTETTDWRTLDAGIALDVLVATRVLGLTYERVVTGGVTYHEVRAPGQTHADFLPAYSSNICDAWQVVEKVTGSSPSLGFSLSTLASGAYVCDFHVDTFGDEAAGDAALAICRAALYWAARRAS